VGGINLPQGQREALRSIDVAQLEELIEMAVWEPRPGALNGLRLGSCGPYVSTRLNGFDRALMAHAGAKAPRKLAETREDARRAGSELFDAVREMRRRVETEEREDELFHVDDLIAPPHTFTTHLKVRVNYRWRRSLDDQWTFETITFLHDVETRRAYAAPAPKPKSSAARLEDQRQEKLQRVWERLRAGALHSVRDHLRAEGSGEDIPETFQATTDPSLGGLNNYSTDFWRMRPTT
jgi:hypothetical protein